LTTGLGNHGSAVCQFSGRNRAATGISNNSTVVDDTRVEEHTDIATAPDSNTRTNSQLSSTTAPYELTTVIGSSHNDGTATKN